MMASQMIDVLSFRIPAVNDFHNQLPSIVFYYPDIGQFTHILIFDIEADTSSRSNNIFP